MQTRTCHIQSRCSRVELSLPVDWSHVAAEQCALFAKTLFGRSIHGKERWCTHPRLLDVLLRLEPEHEPPVSLHDLRREGATRPPRDEHLRAQLLRL